MNNRFKFRFYDNDKKIMIDEDTDSEMLLSEYGKDEWYCCFEATFPTILDYFDSDEYDKKDFVIMQCTGLKDKNGKLIYEGDIVEFYSYSFLDAISNRHMELRKGQVIWNNELLKFDVLVNNHTVPNLSKTTDDNNFEVIGNIYQNKELLEDTECQK